MGQNPNFYRKFVLHASLIEISKAQMSQKLLHLYRSSISSDFSSLWTSSPTSLFLALNQKNLFNRLKTQRNTTCLALSGCLGNPWQCVPCRSSGNRSSCHHPGNPWLGGPPEIRINYHSLVEQGKLQLQRTFQSLVKRKSSITLENTNFTYTEPCCRHSRHPPCCSPWQCAQTRGTCNTCA